ncbi:GH25 family lysozyme [Halopolyspora algeriensis]|nr:GH25 family lysozyme [Halopolyspora algeriensis]
MDQRNSTNSPEEPNDHRRQSATHKGARFADRVQPAAQRFGRQVMVLLQRLWLWLAPFLQRFSRRVALLARRGEEWLSPRMQRFGRQVALWVQRLQRRAAPYVQRLHQWAAPYEQRIQRWAAPYVEPVRKRVAPHVAAVRAKLPVMRTGRHHRVSTRTRSVQIGAAVAAFGVLALVFGSTGAQHRAVDPAVQAEDMAPAAAPAPQQALKDTFDGKSKSGSADESEENSDQPKMKIGPNASGIDVSNHNGSVDWNKVAASGKKFAFVLATDGQSFTNPMFEEQFQGAKEAGLLTGAYHFARPTGSAVAQADRLVNTMGNTEDGKTLPPVLDMEVSPSGGSCYGKSSGEMHTWMQTFLDRVKERTGEKGIVYANPSFWSNCMDGSDAFSEYPLWVAAYQVDQPSIPGGWDKYTFWQFTHKGSVPGVDGYTDINKFQGSGEELLELAD